MYNFLLEASGTLVSAYMIKAVRLAGARAIASDIEECAAKYFADDFIIFPTMKDPSLWAVTEKIISEKGINVVVPTLDETLLTWSEKKQYYSGKGVHIIISNPECIRIFQDKWETYNFFKEHGIPTPRTSLKHEFNLVKPRLGRGGKGVEIHESIDTANMEGMISQEQLKGQEYTIDTLCNAIGEPIYIIPRKRLTVRDGKSLVGITVKSEMIEYWVRRICENVTFTGPINLQCFETPEKKIVFTEINPRVGGGSALGFAASENWIPLIISNIIEGEKILPGEVKYGLKMFRFYDEVFNR